MYRDLEEIMVGKERKNINSVHIVIEGVDGKQNIIKDCF